ARRSGWGRHALLGFGFFLLNLLPALGFARMTFMNISWVADHFVYLPMIGMIGLFVLGVAASGLRGEKGTAPKPGSRMRRSKALHDDESRASSCLRNVPGQIPASVLRSRARCASAVWRWQRVYAA